MRRGLKRLGLVMAPIAAAALLWVLLAGDGGRWLGNAPVVASPEPAPMPAPVALTAASEPEVGSQPSNEASSQPAPTADTARAAPPASASAIKPSAPQAPHPAARAATKAPAHAAPKPREAEEERKPAPRLARPVVPEPAAKPARPVEARASAPRELCADANFFTRPMCIHAECQKAENAQLPVCIEDRQRYPDGRNSTQP